MTKKLSECPYCKRHVDDRGGINHVGGCTGLRNVVLNQLQYDGLTQEIERLKAALRDAARYQLEKAGQIALRALQGGTAESGAPDTSPLAGCGNWKPKHGTGPYCNNCGFHEIEHRHTYPYTRTHAVRTAE